MWNEVFYIHYSALPMAIWVIAVKLDLLLVEDGAFDFGDVYGEIGLDLQGSEGAGQG